MIERRRTPANVQPWLDAALVGGQIATWVWDIKADRVYTDKNTTAFFNLPPDDGSGLAITVYADTLHPEDRALVMALLDQAVRTGKDYEAEYRIVTFDPPRWAYSRGRVEHDADGTPFRVSGVVMDITARKQAERAREEIGKNISSSRAFSTSRCLRSSTLPTSSIARDVSFMQTSRCSIYGA